MTPSPELLDARILVVDDLSANVQLLTRMLSAAGYSSVFSTMEPRDVAPMQASEPFDVILLDLMMPGLDGFAVMEALAAQDPDHDIPVVVITAQPDHKLRALRAGAKDFISKPFELAEVLARVHNMLQVASLRKLLKRHNEQLERRVQERTAELHASYLETTFAMTRAAEHKDEDTGAHVQRIRHYCRELATLLGLDAGFVDRIFFASALHDIGKIGIPDHILLKPGGFTPPEWAVMQQHAAMGAEILGRSTSDYLQMGAEIALNHHERWDGSGYPSGKAGDDIPLCARIVNLCDTYDAIRSRRPYKPARGHDEAMGVIRDGDGRTRPGQFDPTILAMFDAHHDAFRDIYAGLVDDIPGLRLAPVLAAA